jgi:hypothetical protein
VEGPRATWHINLTLILWSAAPWSAFPRGVSGVGVWGLARSRALADGSAGLHTCGRFLVARSVG